MAITDTFEQGETVVCSISIKTVSTSALIDPATSVLVAIYDPLGAVAGGAMTNDSVGIYHYDYTIVGGVTGIHNVVYYAVDGSRTTIQKDSFTVVSCPP
jgi:hypothetical protein